MTAEAFAPAKVNLTLHVTGQRADGYHLLDSLVVFADVGDKLRFDPGPEMVLEVSGPFAQGVPTDRRNLVWQAAEFAGWTGRISLEKNLPHGAGLGGGSADAAALLRSLPATCVNREIRSVGAETLGADVPVCMSPLPQRLRGIGEDVQIVRAVPSCPMVLVYAGVPVPTRQTFSHLENKESAGMGGIDESGDLSHLLAWLAGQRNDLQPPAIAACPAIAEALGALADAACARMSGSGSACFGIYPDMDRARVAAARIGRDHPGWWTVATRTVGSSAN